MLATPAHKEIQEFQFKLLTQLRLFSSEHSIKLDNPSNLVATASKYGLIFVGIPSGITCIQTSSAVNIQSQRTHNRGYITSFPRRELKLGVLPSHIAVSCDNELLAATVIIDSRPLLLIYSVTAFGSVKVTTKCEVRMNSTPGVIVVDLQWNPGVANVIGAVLSDGSAYVYEFKDGTPTISSIPPNAQASCLCWSPKGKQIVIGAKNGSLTQYKPDLKAVKTFAPPQNINQPEVISVHWLSNYQFIAAYKDRINASSKPAVIVVNVPKGASPSFVNYEDICFGFGTNRPEHYFIHQQLWSVIILGTSNGTEVAVLGQNGDSWEQWLQDESNRAQLPVSEDYQDVYLTGMAVDYSPQAPIPIGENNFINPMPFLLMYSQEGVLCFFHCINLLPNSPAICHAPQPLPDQSGMHLFNNFQTEQPEENRVVQEVHGLDGTEQNKSAEAELSKQETHFKLPSFGSDLTSQATKEQVTMALSMQPNFSLLTSQKQNQPISNTNLGNVPNLGGFGLVEEKSSSSATLVAPKFSTSTTLISQQPPSTSTLTFLLPSSTASTPQLSTQTAAMPMLTQLTPNNSAFQLSISSSSVTSQFPTTSTSEISSGNQGIISSGNQVITKPALLTTPLQTNSSLTLISQGISIPSIKPTLDKNTLNKELTTKDPQGRQSNIVTEVKETEVPEMNQVVGTLRDNHEKEQPEVEVDFIGAIKEEVANFKEEMSNQEQLKNSLNFSVGFEEINDLVAKINDLKMFEKDVKETTMAQEAEVTSLVNSVVEMFSWLENVKTKQKQINNPRYMDLMESQDLDPVTKKHINNIEQYIYYLDTQIKQANLQLDALWAQHKGKPIKSFELPNMEAIYQTIVAENYILAAQKVRVTELEVRLKDKLKTFSKKIPHLAEFSSPSLKSNSDIELDVLADKLLLSKLNQNEDKETTSLTENADKAIMLSRSQKYLSPKKESLLHKWHKTHVVINAKSPKRETGQIDLSKYSKVVSKIPANLSSLSDSKPATMTRSIFTITNQASVSSQISHEPEHLVKNEEPIKTESVALHSFTPKSELSSTTEMKPPYSLPNNEVIHKNKTDLETKITTISNAQSVFAASVSQSQSSFRNTGNAWDTKSFSQNALIPSSSQDETVTKNNVVDTNLTNQISSFNINSTSNSNGMNTKTFQPSFSFDSNFSFKTPAALTSLSNSSTSDNTLLKSSKTSSTTAPGTSEVPFSSGNLSESKEYYKKESVEVVSSEEGKDASGESNKLGTTFSSVGTPLDTNAASIPSSEKTVPAAVSIFATSTSANQSSLSAFNFSKNSVFSNINAAASANTTGLKTTSLFGTPLASSNTTSTAPTSILGAKPIVSLSPQFLNSVTTLASTTGSSLITTSATSKPVVTASTCFPTASTTTFFTKPSTMKSIFGNVQSSGTSVTNSSTLFKTSSSPLGTTIFGSSQPQQVFTTVSSATVSPIVKPESVTTNVSATISAAPLSTPSSTFSSTTASTVISTTTVTLSFSSPSVTTALESSTSSLLVTSPTNFVVSTAPMINSSVSSVSTSSGITEKETTTAGNTSFGITSTASSVFGAKTSAQTISGFDTTVSSPNSTPKTFRNIVTAVGTSAVESTSIFGSPVSKPSIFGNQSSSPSFATNSTTSTSSIFSTTTTFVFGSPTTKTTTATIFGTPPPSTFGTSTTNTSVFGAASALSSTSFFGTPTTTSAFPSPSPSLFSTPASTSASSFFGQPVCSPTSTVSNAFSNISFGQKPAAVTTNASVFGGNRPSFETKPLFGMSGGGIFGQTTSSPGTFGLSGGSLFGSNTTFGSPQPQTNLFQSPTGTSGNIFSNTGGGSFSAGNQSVAQSGFGTLPNFQSAPKPFGSSSPPVFGSQTTFGAAPTFGGSATFGSPNKVFGSPSAGTGAFGSPTQQSSTFENLAGQNTLTFGNLAQGQQGFNSNTTFGVGSPQQTSFPTTSSFGGSSFSTWR